jgi:hypothetical protein
MKTPAAALLAVLLIPSGHMVPARATVLQGLDLDLLCDRSPLIVRGKVLALTPGWHDGRILTAVTLQVDRPLYGPASRGDRITFHRLGGEVGGIGQLVVGEPSFRKGEEVVVFLQRRGGRLFVTGMVQGKIRVLPPAGPGGPRRVVSAVGRFTLRGGRHPLPVPTTLSDLEARILNRIHVTGRSTPRGRP